MKSLINIQSSMLPKTHVICFAHAGAGASAFNDWKGQLPPSVEVHALQLPARENRLREPMPVVMAEVLEDVLQALRPLLNKSFVFYGQSMGALLAFETARLLRHRHLPMPGALFVAARRAPHLPDCFAPVAHLPDAALVSELDARYGGMTLLTSNPALLELSLPALRGDLHLAEKYYYVEEPPLALPLHVFYGRADTSLDESRVSAWRQHTATELSMTVLESGHFWDEAGKIRLWQKLSEQLIVGKTANSVMAG